MKRSLLLLSFIVYSLSLVQAQTADDIINKCLDALGGKEKLSSINTLYREGKVDLGGNPIKSKYWAINKTAMRSESEINGMKSYTVIRTDSGWSYSPRRGQKQAEPMTAEAIRRSRFGLDIQSPFLNYKEKGYTIKYLGKDDEIDGSDTYKLELKVNDSMIITYYVDPDSYFIMRTKTRDIVNGRTRNYATNYSDYEKTPDGYVFPMKVDRTKLTVVKVNADIDKSTFVPKQLP